MSTPLLSLFLACASFSEPLDPSVTSAPHADSGSADSRTDPIDSDPGPPDTATDADPATGAEDASELVAHQLPTALACGETFSTRVTMRNTGTLTWGRDGLYKLGAVDDQDPFYERDTRVWLPDGVEVPPGASWSFDFELSAPDSPGTWLTDWQMVHESVRWFGETAAETISVACSEAPPDPEPPAPDLSKVTWLHSDVSGWPQTGTLASVSVSSSEICLDYDKADVWPIYDDSGTEVVGNPWIFIYQDSTWYAGTFEWLRPGQTCKNVDAVAGTHIKQSPFSEDGGWVPQSGDVFYFMVSGLARSSVRNAEERTNLVRVVWP